MTDKIESPSPKQDSNCINVSVSISKEKWDSLSDAEKALARRMGILPKPGSKPVSSGNSYKPERISCAKTSSAIKPYILGIVIDCQLCGETEIQLFDMVKTANGRETTLTATKSSSNITPDKWEVRKVRSCSYCKQALFHQTKMDLVTKILQLSAGTFYRYCRTTRKEDIKNVK